MQPQQAPVKVGETYEVSIEAVGEKGDGIARVKGFVLFVPNAQKGDFLKVKVTKVLPKSGFAEVLGKAEGVIAPRRPKFATVTKAELEKPEEESSEEYEDTENFGEE